MRETCKRCKTAIEAVARLCLDCLLIESREKGREAKDRLLTGTFNRADWIKKLVQLRWSACESRNNLSKICLQIDSLIEELGEK